MILFDTASGSSYEVNQESKTIRRLRGTHDSTPRQGADGEWKPYRAITALTEGHPVLITWPEGTALLEGSPECAQPSTLTSNVVCIRESES